MMTFKDVISILHCLLGRALIFPAELARDNAAVSKNIMAEPNIFWKDLSIADSFN